MNKDTTLFGHHVVDWIIIGACILSIILAPLAVLLIFIKLAREIDGGNIK